MSLPNIGVGSPITINNVNEIINAINRLSLDVQSLQAKVDKAVLSAASLGESSGLYIVQQSYGNREFTITGSQASLPANAVFTAVDIVAIVQNGTNLLNKGFNAKIEIKSGLNTRTLKFSVKVSKDASAPANPGSSEVVKWKFDIDYEIPAGGSAPTPDTGSGGSPGMPFE